MRDSRKVLKMPRLSPNRPEPNPQALAFTISQAVRLGPWSRSTIRRLAASGALEMKKIGGTNVITGESFRRLVGAEK
jgi:hypothetical protein